MSLTTGQREYLLELLSHEYLLTAEQKPVVRQAICQYATTVYDQTELEFLLSMPQSLAICLYYQGNRQQFARQYGLWLNCLEHSIFQEIDCLEAVCINPDPTGAEKLFALLRQEDHTLKIMPLPQLKFSNQPQLQGCSRWTLQEARQSMRQFLQYAYHNANGCQQEIEPMTWSDLLQQARLFPIVKENYQFTGYAAGLPKPSNYQQFLPPKRTQSTQTLSPTQGKRGWLYQPPVNPFAAEMNAIKNMSHSFSNLQQNRPFHLPSLPPLPPNPLEKPPFFSQKKKRQWKGV